MIGAAMQAQEPPLIALVGPTAVGKTAVGIALARTLGAEILSADAVAVYRGLNIGAAKPDHHERAQAVFHLLDLVAPDEDFTLAEFERLGSEAVAAVRERGRIPLLVGGTGLYVRALTATLTVPNVPPQTAFRERLWAEAEGRGTPFLHARLAGVDPVSAEKIHFGDRKRIIRALEVYEITGQPMSAFHTPEGVQGVPRPNTLIFGLEAERPALYQRIEERVDAMMAAGFVEEVRALWAAGYGPSLKSMQSLGYRHLLQHLVEGQPLIESVAELKRDTRRYAKRQISWFKADPMVHWLRAPEKNVTAEAVAAVISGQVNR
ncbi:MAG: tRNA (adenosine(37)-N6)-dimethylallyltransferase MiaA [Cytophagales bacterium]|nr:tRNA (adenosine(37)-N6)-dimethylallyltransferase MiaA [Armatimonadota bacterium]